MLNEVPVRSYLTSPLTTTRRPNAPSFYRASTARLMVPPWTEIPFRGILSAVTSQCLHVHGGLRASRSSRPSPQRLREYRPGPNPGHIDRSHIRWQSRSAASTRARAALRVKVDGLDPRTDHMKNVAHPNGAEGSARVVIEGVTPELDGGRFEVKRVVGE